MVIAVDTLLIPDEEEDQEISSSIMLIDVGITWGTTVCLFPLVNFTRLIN